MSYTVKSSEKTVKSGAEGGDKSSFVSNEFAGG